MFIAQTVRFDRWCQDCRTICGGRCYVAILDPELEFQPERVWKTVQILANSRGHDGRLAALIARNLTGRLSSTGVGVLLEIQHTPGKEKNRFSPPLPVLTMSLSGRFMKEGNLREECFRYMWRAKASG